MNIICRGPTPAKFMPRERLGCTVRCGHFTVGCTKLGGERPPKLAKKNCSHVVAQTPTTRAPKKLVWQEPIVKRLVEGSIVRKPSSKK